MPKPVPPPPPQPSVDETRRAVRFLAAVAASALAFFGLVAASYGPDHPMVAYGRHRAASWNVYKRDVLLDEGALRAHPGGRVAWLFGSSILREAFDVETINADLAARGSEWRVAKFGIARGAPGVIAGFAEAVPIRQGDLVITSMTHANLKRDWVTWTGLPPDRMQYTVPAAEFWHIQSWSLADKLEQAAAVPFGFWQWHEEVMEGYAEWIEAIWWWRLPEERVTSPHLTHRERKLDKSFLARKRAAGIADHIYLGPDCCDYSDDQFNMRGLRRFEALAAARGAELALVYLPPRQEYRGTMVHRDAEAAFEAWMQTRPDLGYAPQPPEEGYYDFTHFSPIGRAQLSAWLPEWLSDGRPRGYLPPLRWPVPEENRPGVAPPEWAGQGAQAAPDDPEDE